MDFEMFMETQIPGYKGLIPDKTLARIKVYYDKKISAEKRWSDCLNLGLNSKAGIDYSTDFQKAGDDFARYTGMLEEILGSVRQTLGVNTSVDVNSSVK